MQADDSKDPRYVDKSPHSAEEQGAHPAPERPVPLEELRRGPPDDKPSQAEGERDGA